MVEASIHDMALFALFDGCNIRALAKVAGLSRPQAVDAVARAAVELNSLLTLEEEGATLSPRQRVRLELLRVAAREQDSPPGIAPASSSRQSPPFALPSPTGASAWRAGPSASSRPGPAE